MARDRRARLLYLEVLGVRGGMGRYNEALVSAYEDAGADVTVLTSSHDASYATTTPVVLSRAFQVALDRRRPRVVRGAAYVLGYVGALARCRAADAIVMHFLHRPSVDYWFIRAFHATGRKVVLVAHDPEPVLEAQRGAAYRRSLQLLDAVVVHGPVARAQALVEGVPEDRLLVAAFGEFRPAPALSPETACAVLGIEPLARPVAAIIGNLKPGKGIQRARQALEEAGSPVRTLLIAGTRQGDWDLDSAVRTSQGSDLRVVRVDRRMTDEEELAAYSAADIVLALYESGFSSGVTARAHSLGKAVVMTHVGDVAEQATERDEVLPVDYDGPMLRDAVRRCAGRSPEAPREWDKRAWLNHTRLVLRTLRLG